MAQVILARVHLFRRDFERARKHSDRALALQNQLATVGGELAQRGAASARTRLSQIDRVDGKLPLGAIEREISAIDSIRRYDVTVHEQITTELGGELRRWHPCRLGELDTLALSLAPRLVVVAGHPKAIQDGHGGPHQMRVVGGDADIGAAFEQFLDDFGRSLGGLISILDPDAVVLGGGISNIDELYTQGVDQVRRYAFHEHVETPILKHHLGDSAGVIGAAWIGK